MLKKVAVNSEVINLYPAKWFLASALLLSSNSAFALTADDVLNKMNSEQRFSFLAGTVGGFAYARYLRDRPDKTGMNCIYDWYYDDGDGRVRFNQLQQWLSRHLDKPIEPLVYVLIKKDCGG